MVHFFLLILLYFFTPVEESAPIVTVLGIAQDGGYPQIGCQQECCAEAHGDPAARRFTASLLVRHGDQRWLVDATPDLREQINVAGLGPRGERKDGRRAPLLDGVFLTHGHMGHYTGLIHLGREAYHHPMIPVYGTARMAAFLQRDQPWKLLVENKNIRPRSLESGKPLSLAPGLTVTPLAVPHRDEITDTFAYIFQGPSRSLLFLPDIDKWQRWDTAIEDVIARVDIALLDGTFYADGEIPGVPMEAIPHPFIQESIERFSKLPEKERAKVVFIHLNHTNPALDPESEAARAIRRTGMRVAVQGEKFTL